MFLVEQKTEFSSQHKYKMKIPLKAKKYTDFQIDPEVNFEKLNRFELI